MGRIKSIGVYCGASNDVPDVFKEAAKDLGKLLAANDVELVYGGGRMGLMGITAKACLDGGGQVYGVIPHFLDAHEGGYDEATELVYVESMHERKQLMYERADAFVILPGGLGTLDELFEIMTWKQVGLHNKFIFILDIKRYWSPIFNEGLDNMIANKFVRKADRNLFTMVERVEDMIPFLSSGSKVHNQHDYVSKWG